MTATDDNNVWPGKFVHGSFEICIQIKVSPWKASRYSRAYNSAFDVLEHCVSQHTLCTGLSSLVVRQGMVNLWIYLCFDIFLSCIIDLLIFGVVFQSSRDKYRKRGIDLYLEEDIWKFENIGQKKRKKFQFLECELKKAYRIAY